MTVSETGLGSRLDKGVLDARQHHSEIGIAVLITRRCLGCMWSSTLSDEREIESELWTGIAAVEPRSDGWLAGCLVWVEARCRVARRRSSRGPRLQKSP